MPLEPTDEQERRIADMLLSCGSTRGCEAADAGRVWDLVRDMVLEAAERTCAGVYVGDADLDPVDPEDVAENCAAAVRAMKGTP